MRFPHLSVSLAKPSEQSEAQLNIVSAKSPGGSGERSFGTYAKISGAAGEICDEGNTKEIIYHRRCQETC